MQLYYLHMYMYVVVYSVVDWTNASSKMLHTSQSVPFLSKRQNISLISAVILASRMDFSTLLQLMFTYFNQCRKESQLTWVFSQIRLPRVSLASPPSSSTIQKAKVELGQKHREIFLLQLCKLAQQQGDGYFSVFVISLVM